MAPVGQDAGGITKSHHHQHPQQPHTNYHHHPSSSDDQSPLIAPRPARRTSMKLHDGEVEELLLLHEEEKKASPLLPSSSPPPPPTKDLPLLEERTRPAISAAELPPLHPEPIHADFESSLHFPSSFDRSSILLAASPEPSSSSLPLPQPSKSPDIADIEERSFSPDLSAYWGRNEMNSVHQLQELTNPTTSVSTSSQQTQTHSSVLDPLNDSITEHDMRHASVSPETASAWQQQLQHYQLQHHQHEQIQQQQQHQRQNSGGGNNGQQQQHQQHQPPQPNNSPHGPPFPLEKIQLLDDDTYDSSTLVAQGQYEASVSPPSPPVRRPSIQYYATSSTLQTPPAYQRTPTSASHAQQSLYHSNNPSIRFVSSYTTATAGCMNQTQLIRRDPRIIGQLLQYFITGFVKKYWINILLVITTIFLIELASQRWIFRSSPLLFLLLLSYKLYQMSTRLTVELSSNVPMHSYTFFKHNKLIQRGKTLPVARMYVSVNNGGGGGAGSGNTGGSSSTGTTPSGCATPSTPSSMMVTYPSPYASSYPPMHHHSHLPMHGSAHHHKQHHSQMNDYFCYQPSEGYCGQTSLNNVLASIPLCTSMIYAAGTMNTSSSAHNTPNTNNSCSTPAGVTSPQYHERDPYAHDGRRITTSSMSNYSSTSTSSSSILTHPQTHRFYLVLPSIVRPFSLTEMEKYLLQCIYASGILKAAVEKVDVFRTKEDWIKENTGVSSENNEKLNPNDDGYTSYLNIIQTQLNDPRYRFMANYLRTPLFFCEEAVAAVGSGVYTNPPHQHQQSAASRVSLGRRLFSGHWSPLLGYLDPLETERMLFRGSVTPAGGAGYPGTPSMRSMSGGTASPLALSASAMSPLQHQQPQPSRSTPKFTLPPSSLASIPSGRALAWGSDGVADDVASSPSDETLAEKATVKEVSPASGEDAVVTTKSQQAEMIAAAPADVTAIKRILSDPPTSIMSPSSATFLKSPRAKSTAGLRSRSAGNSYSSLQAMHAASLTSTSNSSTAALPAATTTSSSSSAMITPDRRLTRAASDATHYSGGNMNTVTTPSSSYSSLHHSSSQSSFASSFPPSSSSSSSYYHHTERSSIQDGLLFIGDVNPSYSYFYTPPKRMYEAFSTVNLVDGERRGVVRITLRQFN